MHVRSAAVREYSARRGALGRRFDGHRFIAGRSGGDRDAQPTAGKPGPRAGGAHRPDCARGFACHRYRRPAALSRRSRYRPLRRPGPAPVAVHSRGQQRSVNRHDRRDPHQRGHHRPGAPREPRTGALREDRNRQGPALRNLRHRRNRRRGEPDHPQGRPVGSRGHARLRSLRHGRGRRRRLRQSFGHRRRDDQNSRRGGGGALLGVERQVSLCTGKLQQRFHRVLLLTPLDERFANSAVALHASGDVTDIWHSRLNLSRVIDDIRQDQVDIYSQNMVGDFEYTSRDTLDLQNDVKIAGGELNQLVTFGGIVASERTNSLSYGTQYAVDTHTETYYVQDQFEAGRNRLLVAGGYYRHPAFGGHETWNAEYGLAVTPETLLIASAGTAFRAPSATDRFGFGGTPDLLPESSRNFEVGVKRRLGDSQLVTFAAFQDTINDLIMFVSDPRNLFFGGENQNIDRARIRGLEAAWELHKDPWSLRAEASLQDPRNLSRNAGDTELLRRTKHSFTLSASRRLGRGELGVDLRESGAREDLDVVSAAPARDGGYVLAAFLGKFSVTPAWSVAARLDNAFNRRYELANGYNTAGRAATISTRYRFH